MSKLTFKSHVVLILVLAIAGCAEKTTGSKTTNVYNSTTTPITGTGGTGGTGNGTGNSGGDTGCDGIPRGSSDVTDCYYSNLPTIVLSGSGRPISTPYWQSSSASGFSQTQLMTDGNFSVRIKPLTTLALRSLQGRLCSNFTNLNFNKMKVELRLKSAEGAYSDTVTLAGEVGSASPKKKFTYLPPTSSPYSIEVLSVLTNHRCQGIYGKLSATQQTECNNGGYTDIPLVLASSKITDPATECVALKIEFATDFTYDLP